MIFITYCLSYWRQIWLYIYYSNVLSIIQINRFLKLFVSWQNIELLSQIKIIHLVFVFIEQGEHNCTKCWKLHIVLLVWHWTCISQEPAMHAAYQQFYTVVFACPICSNGVNIFHLTLHLYSNYRSYLPTYLLKSLEIVAIIIYNLP